MRLGTPTPVGALARPQRHDDVPRRLLEAGGRDPGGVAGGRRREVDPDLRKRCVGPAGEQGQAVAGQRALGIVAAEEVAAARRRTVGLLERPRELFARDGVEGDDLARAVDDGDAVRKAIDDPAASSRS